LHAALAPVYRVEPLEKCVLIVTALMRQIIDIDLENQLVVQPGVINNWVTQAVSGAGFYAPDPSKCQQLAATW